MRILMFGASGFLGREISRSLEKQLCAVTRADRRTSPISVSVQYKPSPDSLIRILGLEKFDAVLNLAAGGLQTRNDLSLSDLEINSVFPGMLASIIKEVNPDTYLLHFASALELSRGPECTEDQYVSSKREGTDKLTSTARELDMELGVIYLNSVFGPEQPRNRFVANTIHRLRNREAVLLKNPYQLSDFLFIGDVVTWVLKILLGPKVNFIAELTSGQPITIRHTAETIADSVGAPRCLIRDNPALTPGNSHNSILRSGSRSVHTLHCPTPFESGLAMSLDQG